MKKEEEEERGKKGWGWEDRRDVGTNLRNEDDRFQLDGAALAPLSSSPSVRPVGLVTLLRQHPVSSGCCSVSSLFARHYSSSATVSPYDSVPTCSLLLACEILLSRQ